ncbi:DUF5691 domain-containing protein [Actinomadura sp. CNU-125]|uniref:DUF5691 domain-containing protein n=1 Tax=Actinomadura sp. CNU-125 TaxID=1904961 RepID=UPI0011789D0B|nr:DUF5691 domain-containing protein [Actinomadura sp. CNU-125]
MAGRGGGPGPAGARAAAARAAGAGPRDGCCGRRSRGRPGGAACGWRCRTPAGPTWSGPGRSGRATSRRARAAWRSGTRHRRAAYLSRLRGTDPAAARALLRESWDREPAPDRAAFLGTFAWGLSLDDEPFLEAALDDRGKDVRQLAADLLARLPGTAYGERMAERARACVTPRTDPMPGAGTRPDRPDAPPGTHAPETRISDGRPGTSPPGKGVSGTETATGRGDAPPLGTDTSGTGTRTAG